MKRLKNIETNQKSNNNDKSKSRFYTPSSSDDETQTSFEYLKDNTDEFFSYSDIFDPDLKEFFNYIASEGKKSTDYEMLQGSFFLPPGNVFNFLQNYGDLYNFSFNLLFKSINLDDFKLREVEFLKDLMNGFEVYKKIKKPKNESDYKAEDLYLKLLGNPNNTVDDISLKEPTDKYNREIYLQGRILFNLRERIFKRMVNEIIIKSDSDQSDTKYEDSIAERTKLRRQKSNEQLDTTNVSELESEESAEQKINPQGHGLKILTPNQMLSRLLISLAQLNAGNNSEKLKNGIRQQLYSLYRSEKLTKQIYKSLIDII